MQEEQFDVPAESSLSARLDRETRKVALALMLSAESSNDYSVSSALDMKESLLETYDVHQGQFRYAVGLLSAVGRRLREVDEELQRVSPRWKLERIAAVDRNLLRLGILELLFFEGLTARQIRSLMSDYVSLGRDFGEQNTHAFVNGLLDQVCKDHRLVTN